MDNIGPTDSHLGYGPPSLLPRHLSDNSIIPVPVMRPEDVGKVASPNTGNETGREKKKKPSFFSFGSQSNKNKFTIKQMPRSEYLKHYAQDKDGRYVGTEEPAADCILNDDDARHYRGKTLEYEDEIADSETTSAPLDDGVIR